MISHILVSYLLALWLGAVPSMESSNPEPPVPTIIIEDDFQI